MKFLRLLVLLCLPFTATAQTSEDDRGYLTGLIESSLSGDDRVVTITGFEGALSSEARIARMTIADADGVWLTLEDMVLQWNRLALLRGAISVQQLRAGRVIVDRAPLPAAAAPTPEAQGFALPELPVSVTLGVLQIDRIELAPVFLGEAVVVNLAGSAALAGGEGNADLRAQRVDGAPGTFTLNGSYDNESRALAVLLDIDEAADGIAARLLDLPGRPSVKLTVAGDAPLDDFAATLALSTDGQDRLAGDFALVAVAGGQQVRLDLGGDVSALFAPEYQPFFGRDARLQVALNQGADGSIDIPRIALSAGRVTLDGAVRIGAQGWPQTVRITGEIAADGAEKVLLPLPGARTLVDDVTLAVNFDAAVSDQWLLDLTATGLERPGLRLATLGVRGGGVLQSGEGAATGVFTADLAYGAQGLQLDDVATAQALGDTVSGALRVTRTEGAPTRISRLTLAGAGIDIAVQGTIAGAGAGFATDLSVQAQVAGLQRFSTLAGRDLGGRARLDGTVLATPLDGLFDISLDGVTTDLRVGVAQADAVLAGAATLVARVVRDAAGTRLENLAVVSDAGQIDARATLTSAGSDADLRAALRDVSVVVPELSGAATANGRVTLSETGQISFALSGDAPSATYASDGTVIAGPDGRDIDLTLRADVTDLAAYGALAGRPLGGAAGFDARVLVQDDGAALTLDINGQTQDLITGVARLDPLLAGPGVIAAVVARGTAGNVQVSGLRVQTPALSVQGSGDLRLDGPVTADLELRISDAGVIDPSLSGPVALTLTATPTPDETTSTALRLSAPQVDIRLDATVAGRDAGYAITGDLSAQAADLAAYAGVIGQPLRGSVDLTASGTLRPDLTTFDAQINLRSENLGVGNATADRLLAGTGRINATIGRSDGIIAVRTLEVSTPQVSLVGALNGNAGVGQGRFNASLRDIGLLTDQISGPVRATGTASLDSAGTWGVDATGTGPGGLSAAVRGSVAQAGTLDLVITGAAPLALLNAAIEPRRLSGTANFDLRAAGAPGLDAIGGQITFGDGRLAAPTLAQAISGISGAVRLGAGTARIDLRGNVEAGGTIAVSGPIGLAGGNTADVTITLGDVVVKDPQLYRTTIGGAITLQGPLQGGARIAGQLALGQTNVQVPSSSVSPLGALPDVRHRAPSQPVRTTLARAGLSPDGAPAATETASAPRRAYPLNIVIDAPSRIFIRGRGLDAELGGQLTIGGTSANVIPVGRFDLQRGRIDILSQRFTLTEGSASLQGDFEPYIRLVAATQSASGTAIRIIVEGPAGAPEISFESVPELPQDEVLSQLIFGRDLQSISAFQAVQLASAISTLAGGSGGAMGQLRNNLGLDDFDVTTDSDGNAAVRAGAYLSENVYTDVTVSAGGGTEINLNLDITDEIVAKGGVDQDGTTSVGVFFERDY